MAAALGALDWAANANAGIRFRAQAQFLPYQFRPLMKFLSSGDGRLLIADETGLGKTVEAGYIIAQAIGERSASRILVVCPPRLRFKWTVELRTRFGLRMQELNADGLRRYVAGDQPFLGIVSSDAADVSLIRQLQTADGAPLDLVIVDEIHGMIGRGAETLRRQMGMALSAAAREFVGISATPVNLEIGDIRRILEVIKAGEIAPKWFESALKQAVATNRLIQALGVATWDSRRKAEFDALATGLLEQAEGLLVPPETVSAVRRTLDEADLTDPAQRAQVRHAFNQLGFAPMMTRTRSVEVGQQRNRIIKTVQVRLDRMPLKVTRKGQALEVSEALLYDQVDLFLGAHLFHAHRLQLSSCLPAMVGLLRQGANGLTTWSQDEGSPTAGHRLDEAERKNAEALAEQFDLLPSDSKWNTTIELLREVSTKTPTSKVLLFTHWRPTFDHLVRKAAAAPELKFFLASPQHDDRTIGRTIAQFRAHDGFAVLLTTDILSEGVDLQVADTVINYDLPYNPQILEQRIGRIDRLGQKSAELRVYNVLVAGSLDERIHAIILSRAAAFEHSVGEMKPIVEEMGRALADRGTIDENLAIRLVNAAKVRQEILSHPALSIPDHFLDAEIRAARVAPTQVPQQFRIAALAWFLQQLAPSADIRLDVPGQSISVVKPEPAHTVALLTAMPLEDREDTAADLERYTRSGHLELSIGALPDAHPLLRVAAKIAALRFTNNEGLDCATIQATPPVLEGVTYVGLFQFQYRGQNVSRSEWVWIGLDRQGTTRPISDAASTKLLGSIIATSSIQTAAPPSPLFQAAEKMANEWAEKVKRAEAAAVIAHNDRRLSYMRFLQQQAKKDSTAEEAVRPIRKTPPSAAEVEELTRRLAHLRTPAALQELRPTITIHPAVVWRERDLA